MAKIMLVEDDKNLSEIYEARLAAEGYDIVSAQDGEEALAMAVKERPDLIISDVMMPKISGFDMLDILRTTPETKHTKVVMMTALSQAEDKARADKLGADYYLVKSQATLEDIARVAHNILEGKDPGASPNDPVPAAATPAYDMEQPAATGPSLAPTSIPVTTPDDSSSQTTPATDDESATPSSTDTSNDELVAKAVNELMSQAGTEAQAPKVDDTKKPIPVAEGPTSGPDSTVRNMDSHSHNRVIEPITPGFGDSKPDLGQLAAQEETAATPQSESQAGTDEGLTGWSMDAPEPTPSPDDMPLSSLNDSDKNQV